MADSYAAADVLVFPVEWEEPWGLVPLEAMASGVPVVATGAGGSGEYLRDGENSVLFPAGDEAALARALSELAGDPERRESLRRGGLQTAARHTTERYNRALAEAMKAA
jgi:glycosyltransferase involved in cell wall biosynthesis